MSKAYELTGSIKEIGEVQEFSSGFKKREIVVTVPDGEYPQDIKLEVVKDKCDALNQYSAGQEVEVAFNIRGNEYNGKYYVNLQAWKIASIGGNSAPTTPKADEDDSIPF